MINVTVKGREVQATPKRQLTSGSVGLPVTFNFTDDWDGYQKIAVFKGSGTMVDVALLTDECVVPSEVMTTAGDNLWIGIYGEDAQTGYVIPTIWGKVGHIYDGAEPSGVDPSDPTPSWAAQVQAAAAEALEIAEAVQDAAEAYLDENGILHLTTFDQIVLSKITVTDITGGHRITIVDEDGTTTVDVMDGQDGSDGADGTDGVSPAVTVTNITGGHTVTITDKDHPSGQSFNVMDGAAGSAGATGPAGPGVAAGGTTGQVLKKKSNADYDTEWANESGGGGGADNVFWATYNTTTYSDLLTAYQADKLCACIYDGLTYYLNVYDSESPLFGFLCVNDGAKFLYVYDDNSWEAITYPIGTYSKPSGGIPASDMASGVIPSASSATPQDLGTAAAGSSTSYARADHVHKKPTASDIGAYTKPSSGIPATDLASAVQTSLGKADSALQSANDVYWCTYGTTTSAQIETAISAGKTVCVTYNDYTYTLRYRNSATNHRFVCNYGGKEYNLVCQSDTWAVNATYTFLTSAPVASVDGKTGTVTVLPSGGNAGQVLKKNSATDYDVKWANETQTYTSAYSTTSGSTAAKTASCSLWTATANSYLHVIMGAANSYAGAITLNVNAVGAKPIYINGAASSASNYTLPAGSYIVFYDGTNFYFRTDGKLTANITGSADGSEDLYICTYGMTTATQIADAITAGKIPVCVKDDVLYVYGYESSGSHYFASTGLSSLAYKYLICNSSSTWTTTSVDIAPKNSPTFTGTPAAPTATAGTNTTQIATTEFVQTAVSGAIAAPSSPTAGDFLVWNGSAWAAQSLSAWQASSY